MEVAINTKITSPELAPESAWFKSSYSNDTGGNCIEVTDLTNQVGIRDSKDKSGPALVVPAAAWSSFVGLVRSGDVDFSLVGR
ncbi:DUF397 domain-containing protein [Streptomyces noursei]|uniref:DUF397 domain-containing protein n=1 Tax=Streptomyces noursei TaxID=1971 RepID=UPI0019BA5780|nr:DUF397 domain-containing protein [Streptomyces noursei]MCZ1021332.1 DUF397 domain-containing protein [Streptomyces noursei]GGX51733.1 hypothetical protein GCM10010341_86480 [Streptomyces noursei]